MFEKIINYLKGLSKKEKQDGSGAGSKDTAKERLHLVLMQDRANVSADFLELMKQEIIDVIKKYIEVDESAIDVRLTNKANEDGTTGAPALYANIPIMNIKHEMGKDSVKEEKTAETMEKDSSDNNKEDLKESEEVEESIKEKEEEKKEESQENENPEENNEQLNQEESIEDKEEKKEETTTVESTSNEQLRYFDEKKINKKH